MYVKKQMSTNSKFIEAITTAVIDEPGTSHANDALLCLQNVSFPDDTRLDLMRTSDMVTARALAHVLGFPADDEYTKPKNTALSVLSNMTINKEIKLETFRYKDNIFCKVS